MGASWSKNLKREHCSVSARGSVQVHSNTDSICSKTATNCIAEQVMLLVIPISVVVN